MSSRIQHSGATNMLDTAAVFLLSGGLLTSEDCTDIRRHYREYDRRWPDPAFPAAAKKPENIGAKTAEMLLAGSVRKTCPRWIERTRRIIQKAAAQTAEEPDGPNPQNVKFLADLRVDFIAALPRQSYCDPRTCLRPTASNSPQPFAQRCPD
jgi:hypothetical protein